MNRQRPLVGSIALTACLLMAGGRSEAQPQQNLLKNGSFETWSAGPSAFPDGWDGTGGISIARSTLNVDDGGVSAHVQTGPTTSGEYLQQAYPASPTNLTGRQFSLSARVFVATGTAVLSVRWLDAAGGVYVGGERLASSVGTGWQTLTGTTAPAPANASRLEVRLHAAGPNNDLYWDRVVLVEGTTPVTSSPPPTQTPQPSAIQFRGKICTGCEAEMSLAGHPDDSQRLVHVSRDTLSLSTDGGRTWQSKSILGLTNGAYKDGAINASLVALENGTFAIATMASITAKANKLGGVLYQGGWTGPLGASIFQDIPANDTHDALFPFIAGPTIAAQPPSVSGTLFILGDAWFEATKTRAPALYLWDQNTKTVLAKQRLDIPEAPTVNNIVNNVSIPTSLVKIGAATLTREGQLYAVAAYPTEVKAGALIKGELLRFRTTNPVAFDRFLLPSNAHVVSPRLTNQSTHAWLADQGPELLVDTSPTSPYRGRLYVVWSQEERVVTDPTFEAGNPLQVQGVYGVNYHLYAISSTDRGATWSSSRRIDQDTGAVDHAYPSAALDKNGTLHVAFVGLREPALAEVFYAYSTDGGVNFSKSLKISEQPLSIIDPAQKDDNEALGDFLHMVTAYADGVYVGYPCNGGADACLAKLPGVSSNQLPTLSGLSDQTVQAGNTVSFDVSATDPDTAPSNLVFSYSPVLPGASFQSMTADPTNHTATWRFTWPTNSSQIGSRSVTFKVTDDPSDTSGQRTAAQTITITVTSPPPEPQPPALTVNAGLDQTITLPNNTATLTGTANRGTVSWSKFSGPGTVTFSTPTALTTTATFSTVGTYVLRLTATSGADTAQDEVQVTVQVATPTGPTIWVEPQPDNQVSGLTRRLIGTVNGLPPQDLVLTIPAGQRVSFNITGGPQEPPADFTITSGAPAGATMTPRYASATSSGSLQFTWTPTPQDARPQPYILSILGTTRNSTSLASARIQLQVTWNSPPTVDLTASVGQTTYKPGDHVTVKPGDVVMFKVTAHDNGSVSRVFLRQTQPFQQDSALVVNTDTTALSWSTSAVGTYRFIGMAVDNENKDGSSGEIVIEVTPGSPPAVVPVTPPTTWTLTATPSRVQVSPNAPLPEIEVRWNAPAGQQATNQDLIGLFPTGEAAKTFGNQGVKFVGGGQASGSLRFTVPAWAGTYEFRYFRNYNLAIPVAVTPLLVDGPPRPLPSINLKSIPQQPGPGSAPHRATIHS